MAARTMHPALEEAREHLMTCTEETPRDLVAWAAGAWVAPHALHFHKLPLTVAAIAPEHSGSTAGGRTILATKGGGVVIAQSGVALTTVSWTEVTALVTPARVGGALRAQIREALRLRVELTPAYDPRHVRNWQPSKAHVERRKKWAEIESRCYELGGQVWARCHPGEQLSLFEALRD